MAVIVPLVGFDPQIPALSWIKIPNFVSDIIFKTPLYLAIYCILIVILIVIAFFLEATVPAMLVDDLGPVSVMRKSIVFMRKNWKSTIQVLAWNLMILVGSIVIIAIFLVAIAFLGTYFLPQTQTTVRFSTLLSALVLAGYIGFLTLILAPVQMRNFTRIYALISKHETHETISDHETASERKPDNAKTEARERQALLKITAVSVAALAGIVGVSAVASSNFDQIFNKQKQIFVTAHRAGGDLDAENSLEGLEKAIEVGAQWAEIDIQRTKDGVYIVNHDPTFDRLAGVSAGAQELDSDEISKIEIKNEFDTSAPSRSVPTIEQMIDKAKGKIGLFIELKGATADKKMVDDMAIDHGSSH